MVFTIPQDKCNKKSPISGGFFYCGPNIVLSNNPATLYASAI